MNQNKISVEKTLYALSLLIALFLRLIFLDKLPLGDLEAGNALQAFDIVSGNGYQVGSQPGLVSLTTFFFSLFESSTFFARFVPALCGSFLVLLPYLYKKIIGQKQALLLSFFLALDPAMIAFSRQSQGTILALFFIFLAMNLIFINKKMIWGGVSLALALLSGPQFFTGLVILLLTWVIWTKLFKGQFMLAVEGQNENPLNFKKLVLITAAALVLISTGFFLYPELITGFGNSITGFFKGWTSSEGYSFLYFLLSLLVYEGILLLFGLVAAIRNVIMHEKKLQLYFIWFIVSLLVILIYPGRQISDLLWSLIPLGLLAVNQVTTLGEFFKEEKWTFMGQSLLVLIIVLFIFYNLLGMFNNPLQGNVDWQIRLAGIIGGLVLVVVLSILMWWGWSGSVARNGLVWGMGGFLLILYLSAGWHSAGLGQSPEAELWFDGNYVQDAVLLADTIDSIAEWNMVSAGDPVILVENFESPSLRWALRTYQYLEFTSLISLDASPDFIITPSNQSVEQFASYTGQDFIWNVNPAWGLILPEEWINWAFYKSAPLEKESIILWVRSELFPGYEMDTSEN